MNEFVMEQGWIERLLTTLDKLAAIPEKEKALFLERLHVIKINKNDHFISAGQRPDKVAFIAEGLFRVYYLSDAGKENCLVFRESGRFLSAYNSLLDNTVSKYSFQALEDSVLLYVTLKDYAELLKENECWQRVVSKYFQMLFIEKEEREIELLSIDAKKRYKIFVDKYPELPGRVSQYHIASYLGITPEALSRIRRQRINIDQ
jgi:CRP-like cAMP-binding protein